MNSKKLVFAITLMCCITLLVGCEMKKTQETDNALAATINPEDVSEEQLIEFVSTEDIVIFQINGKNDIANYLQNANRTEWEEVNEIPAQAELQYIIMSYEKVIDEFWLEKGAPEISMIEEQFYEDNGIFYIKELFEDNPVNYHIPVSTGKYIVNLVQKGSDISDKNDIFASWGVKDFEPGSAKDLDLDIFDGFSGGNAAKSHSYSADELADVSKEQKIEIVFQNPEATYTMTELEEIAEFYNQIKRDTWTEIGQIPDEKNDICAITTYQLERYTKEKNLVENEKMTVFEVQNQYYILDIIPGTLSGMKDMEIYYSIPNDVANYIKEIVQ